MMAPDGKTGQTTFEILNNNKKKGRGYNHYQEIVLYDVKRERSGRATRRWPIFIENVFFFLTVNM